MDELQRSGILNRQQQIGVKYYDEFIERMPREEVTEIETKVVQLKWPSNKTTYSMIPRPLAMSN